VTIVFLLQSQALKILSSIIQSTTHICAIVAIKKEPGIMIKRVFTIPLKVPSQNGVKSLKNVNQTARFITTKARYAKTAQKMSMVSPPQGSQVDTV